MEPESHSTRRNSDTPSDDLPGKTKFDISLSNMWENKIFVSNTNNAQITTAYVMCYFYDTNKE